MSSRVCRAGRHLQELGAAQVEHELRVQREAFWQLEGLRPIARIPPELGCLTQQETAVVG